MFSQMTNFLNTESPDDYAVELRIEFRLYQSEQLQISKNITVW